MPNLGDVFSAPFHWCDRRCERCPLEEDCPLPRRERQQRWVHEARGRDPDDWSTIMDDLNQMLASTLRMVREIAEAEGIDVDAPLPKRPAVLAAKRLERAGMDLVLSASELWRAEDADPDDHAELRIVSTKLATKAARIASYLDNQADDETWAWDGAPNLLLVDHLKRDFAHELARLAPEGDAGARVARALAELERILDPLIHDFGDGARSVLAALVARGAAPSPFVCKQEQTAPPARPRLRLVRKDS